MPSERLVIVHDNQRVRAAVELARPAPELAPVRVEETGRTPALDDPTGFGRRQEPHAGGVFMTEEEISRRSPARTEQLFRGIPSVNADTGGLVIITRGDISFRDYYLPKRNLTGINTCIGAVIFVDGAEMPPPFDQERVRNDRPLDPIATPRRRRVGAHPEHSRDTVAQGARPLGPPRSGGAPFAHLLTLVRGRSTGR